MKTLKQIVALLLSIAALLASIFSLMDVKRNVERNKQAADFATPGDSFGSVIYAVGADT